MCTLLNSQTSHGWAEYECMDIIASPIFRRNCLKVTMESETIGINPHMIKINDDIHFQLRFVLEKKNGSKVTNLSVSIHLLKTVKSNFVMKIIYL